MLVMVKTNSESRNKEVVEAAAEQRAVVARSMAHISSSRRPVSARRTLQVRV